IATRAWAIAIARLLVPAEHVECEAPGPDCTGDAPALAGYIESESRPLSYPKDIRGRYTPRWYDGVPVATDEAYVLDPTVPRSPPDDGRTVMLPGASIMLRRVGPTPIGGLGSCDTWGLVGGSAGVIAVDRANGRWTWITLDGAGGFADDVPACTGDLVLTVHYCCTDSRAVYG